jgi:hypothetical protein
MQAGSAQSWRLCCGAPDLPSRGASIGHSIGSKTEPKGQLAGAGSRHSSQGLRACALLPRPDRERGREVHAEPEPDVRERVADQVRSRERIALQRSDLVVAQVEHGAALLRCRWGSDHVDGKTRRIGVPGPLRSETAVADVKDDQALTVAEREGFEPSIPETGIPDFESGAFDHSATFPRAVSPWSEAADSSRWGAAFRRRPGTGAAPPAPRRCRRPAGSSPGPRPACGPRPNLNR